MDIENVFNYHAPEPDQIVKYGAIRAAGALFALTIERNTPP